MIFQFKQYGYLRRSTNKKNIYYLPVQDLFSVQIQILSRFVIRYKHA